MTRDPAQTPLPAVGRCGIRQETWLPATAASARSARSLVRGAAAEAGLEGEAAWDLMVATTEAVTNSVQHGKAWPNGCVLFVTEPCPRGLRVEVWDVGTFDSALDPAPLEATSGRGMQIIAAVVDRLEVTKGEGRTLVRFEKHRGPPSPEDHERAPRIEPAAKMAADAEIAYTKREYRTAIG